MDAKKIPVVVRMRVDCAACAHHEDETYEFDMPLAKAQPMEGYELSKCPECGAAIKMRLKRWQQMQELFCQRERMLSQSRQQSG